MSITWRRYSHSKRYVQGDLYGRSACGIASRLYEAGISRDCSFVWGRSCRTENWAIRKMDERMIGKKIGDLGMKKIGLVGGTGPESTLSYYKKLNEEIDRVTCEKSMPDICIESVNFRRAWEYVVKDDREALTEYLAEKVRLLKAGGAQVLSLTAVTMHMVFDELEKRTGVTLVSIPKAVCEEIVKAGIKKVGLLGTMVTMEQDYMKKDLTAAGVEVFVPNEQERELVAKRIYEELEKGSVKESTLQEFQQLIRRMEDENGIEGVILGCTELPLLLNSGNCPVPCFDSVEIHLRKLVELVLEN